VAKPKVKLDAFVAEFVRFQPMLSYLHKNPDFLVETREKYQLTIMREKQMGIFSYPLYLFKPKPIITLRYTLLGLELDQLLVAADNGPRLFDFKNGHIIRPISQTDERLITGCWDCNKVLQTIWVDFSNGTNMWYERTGKELVLCQNTSNVRRPHQTLEGTLRLFGADIRKNFDYEEEVSTMLDDAEFLYRKTIIEGSWPCRHCQVVGRQHPSNIHSDHHYEPAF